MDIILIAIILQYLSTDETVVGGIFVLVGIAYVAPIAIYFVNKQVFKDYELVFVFIYKATSFFLLSFMMLILLVALALAIGFSLGSANIDEATVIAMFFGILALFIVLNLPPYFMIDNYLKYWFYCF